MNSEETERQIDHRDSSGNKWKIPKFFANPIVGLVASIASIISIPLSVILFWANLSSRQLSYYVNPIKATVVSPVGASKLKVYKGQLEVTNEVTAAQVAIWNAGNQSIKQSDILKPIVLYTDPPTAIIEAKVRRQSRDVVDLQLLDTESDAGRIRISWRILERKDGGVVQLIYTGSPAIRILLEGTTEGQSAPILYKFKGRIQSPEEQYNKREFLVLVFLAVMIALQFFLFVVEMKRIGEKKFGEAIFTFVSAALFIYLFVSQCIEVFETRPPFGF